MVRFKQRHLTGKWCGAQVTEVRIIILFFIFISASFFVPWEKVFNVSVAFSHELKLLLPIVFGLFCSQLALRLITTIYVADQKNSFQDLIHCIINVVSLLVIWIMSKFFSGSLLVFGIVYSIIPVVVLTVISIY